MNFLREIVSGPKNRFREDGYNLDLTYICNRLIAMSFPASGVESVYRNPIDKVTKFIRARHGQSFLVFNLSARMYDYSKFQDQVLDFQWEDHHSPPIHTLFLICQKIQLFLLGKLKMIRNTFQNLLSILTFILGLTVIRPSEAKSENICIIHCLAGKGRTGTIICCFLIYSGLISSTSEALNYYSKKRFILQGFGVNQPCQIRYLEYFFEVLKNRELPQIYPKLVYIKKVIFYKRPNFNTQRGCRPYFDLIYVRSKQLIFSTKKSYSNSPKFQEGDMFEIPFDNHVPISGDLLIRIKHNGYYKNQKMARISFNTAFIPDTAQGQVLKFNLNELSPSSLLKDDRFPKEFCVEIHFGSFCSCSRFTSFKEKCSCCGPQLIKERDTWEIMQRIVKNYRELDKLQQRSMLFGNPVLDDVNTVLTSKKPVSTSRFKFDNEQDKFISDANLPVVSNFENKVSSLDSQPQNSNEELSSIKIRQRSDVRYNIYSDDNAFSVSKNLKMKNGIAQNDNHIGVKHLQKEKRQSQQEEAPPSPLSPRNSYFKKKSNDTDDDSQDEIVPNSNKIEGRKAFLTDNNNCILLNNSSKSSGKDQNGFELNGERPTSSHNHNSNNINNFKFHENIEEQDENSCLYEEASQNKQVLKEDFSMNQQKGGHNYFQSVEKVIPSGQYKSQQFNQSIKYGENKIKKEENQIMYQQDMSYTRDPCFASFRPNTQEYENKAPSELQISNSNKYDARVNDNMISKQKIEQSGGGGKISSFIEIKQGEQNGSYRNNPISNSNSAHFYKNNTGGNLTQSNTPSFVGGGLPAKYTYSNLSTHNISNINNVINNNNNIHTNNGSLTYAFQNNESHQNYSTHATNNNVNSQSINQQTYNVTKVCPLFQNSVKMTQNLVSSSKDSFEDLEYQSDDDPCPQKPIQGDKIFVNGLKHF